MRRSRRAGVATAVAVALVALCVAVIVSLAQRLSGNREFVSYDSVAARLHGTEWGDPVVFGVGAVAALLGLALLAAAVLPGRAVVVPLRPLEGDDAGIDRRSLRSALRRSAGSVPGVSSARITMRGNEVRVSAESDRTEVGELPDTVRRAVTESFERIGTDPAPPVRAQVRPARRSSK